MSSQAFLNGLVVMIMLGIVEYTNYQSTIGQSKQAYRDKKCIDQEINDFLELEKLNVSK